jgi:hypothetical protein
LKENKKELSFNSTFTKYSIIANPRPPIVKDPVRFSVFNDGNYHARLELNYILDDLQAEQVVNKAIVPTEERDLFLPSSATHIRVRVREAGLVYNDNIVDEQIPDLVNVTEKCYLLAGTRSEPIYGICPVPYAQYYQMWTAKR